MAADLGRGPGPALRAVDKRRHAAALAVTPVGEEALRVADSAQTAAVDRADARGLEVAPGERIEIGLPAASLVRLETGLCPGVAGNECGADLVSHLERGLRDRRAEPREETPRRRAHVCQR